MTVLAWPAFQVALCLELAHASSLSSLLPSFPIQASPPSFEVWTNVRPGQTDVTPTSEKRALNFPLQQTLVRAEVSSGVVHAKVIQRYHNSGSDCLQSRYIFPLPTKAAISAMTMRIGNRTVAGTIRTRETARQEFNAAKLAGYSASLLDQERPNVFAMELANILPGEYTEVEVEYSETLSPIDGIYAFTFPAVVGPRYGVGWAPGKDTSNLETHVDLNVKPSCKGMNSALTMQLTNDTKSTKAVVKGKNADIVLKFWFTETAVGGQFLLSQRGSEKYFSLAIQPPQRRLLDSTQICKREYVFILDVSGSMKGYPIQLSKTLMTKLLKENVRPGDSFNIMLFAGGDKVFSRDRSVEATPESIERALSWLDANMNAWGGTQLLPALRNAFNLPRGTGSVARTVVIMTDGYVTVEREAFDLVRKNLGQGSVFCFGVGGSVNRYIIDGLARVGYGEPFVVTDQQQGEKVVEQLRLYIDSPVLTSLRLTFSGDFRPQEQEPPLLPDVFASRPIHVIGKYEGSLAGKVSLVGRLADGESWEYSADLAQVPVEQSPAVPLLWARSRIAILSDYGQLRNYGNFLGADSDSAMKTEVTKLGLNYSLMTEFTSFVAIDSHPSAPATCAVPANNKSNEIKASQPKPEQGSGSFSSTGVSTSGYHTSGGILQAMPSALATLVLIWTLMGPA